MTKPFHKSFGPITSVQPRSVTQRELKVKGMPAWSVRRSLLHGGKQEGVELIEVNNGKLSFTVIPTRGMNILKAVYGDVRLGWDSPVKEVVHPKFINLESRGGLGWLEGFNEWLVRCGLEFFGPPGPGGITLHGRITNTPASEVELVVDREPPYRIRLRGRVEERCMFGPKLELQTEYSTEPGSPVIHVEDTVRNCGGTPQELQLLYHVNYGAPLLETGSHFKGAVKKITPANDYCAQHLAEYETYAAPKAGFAEQVYLIEPAVDKNGRTLMMLQNAAATRGVAMSFATAQLPCFTLWKNTVALEDGCVTGLEPGIGFPRPRALEKEAGRIPILAPGESRTFAIDVTILATPEQVRDTAAKIDQILSKK